VRSRLVAIVLALPIVFGVAGCSVPNNGITGVTVDGSGNLLGAFAWCDDNPPDGATVYDPGGFNGKTVAIYRAPALTGHTATVRLDTAADGWQVKPAIPQLDPNIEYRLYSWTDDASASTAGVHFHLADRDHLSVGTVLAQYYDEARDRWATGMVSMAEFEHLAKHLCR
jgi:hypothetical protein